MSASKHSNDITPAPLSKRTRRAPRRLVEEDSDIEVLDANPITTISRTNSTTTISRTDSQATPTSDIPISTIHGANDDITPWFDLQGRKAGVDQVCKICRSLYEGTNPRSLPSPRFVYSYSSGSSTSTLRAHAASAHDKAYIKHCADNKLVIGHKPLRDLLASKHPRLDKWLLDGIDSGKPGRLSFSQVNVRNALVRFIVADDQSLNVVESPEFRSLLLTCAGDKLNDSDIPHRHYARSLVLQMVAKRYAGLLSDIKKFRLGKVSFTADIWTNQNLAAYLAITAHWIRQMPNGRLQLQSDLIAFRYFPERHTGENIAQLVLDILKRGDLLDCIGWFTMDNASNNDTFMTEFSSLLAEERIEYEPIEHRIRCFPHVIHLAVMAMIKACTDISAADLDAVDFPPRARLQLEDTFEAALARDVIATSRTLIQKIRVSSLCRERFRTTQCSEMPGVAPKELLRDCPTRWSSLYFMIDRLIELRPAVDTFVRLTSNADLEPYGLTTSEWDALILLRDLFKIPHAVQQILSWEKVPTLAHVVPAYEILLSKLHEFKQAHAEVGDIIEAGMIKLRQYYDLTDMTHAYVIAQVLNPAFKFSRAEATWSVQYQKTAKRWLLADLAKYSVNNPLSHSPATTPPSLAALAYAALGAVRHVIPVDQSLEDEMSAYLSASLADPSIDIVQYWMENRTRFPTFFKMAMDYLPIQASAVPSERIFSSGKETDTKRRNRLSPNLMEALQLLKFLLKKNPLDFTAHLRDDGPDEFAGGIETDVIARLLQSVQPDDISATIDSLEDVL